MKTQPVLILLGHGSRARKTLEEMEALAEKLQDSSPKLKVLPAFLTLLEPDLAQALETAIKGGAKEIHVLPLFFFSGKHVLEDIPALFGHLEASHPEVKLVLREPLGRHPGFFDFLLRAGGFG